MTELIRTWPDAGFYLSQVGTANIREQINKLQNLAPLLRALSDASTVDTNGDKLQDRLTGISLGNQTQRHKWRVLYDTTNDRFLVQRNTGTDASKVWSERFRIDSSGNVTTTGTLTADSIQLTTPTSGGVGIRMAGDLDMNDFYIRNAQDIFTDDLRVGSTLTLQNNHRVGWVYITSKTAASSPVIDFAGLTHYPKYKVELDQIRCGTDSVSLSAVLSTNNGATYLTTAIYGSAGLSNLNFGTGIQEQCSTGSAAAWNLVGDGGVAQDNNAGSALTGTVYLNSLGSATLQARGRSQVEFIETNALFSVDSNIALFANPGAVVNAIRFFYSSGVITSGTFRLYGLRNT